MFKKWNNEWKETYYLRLKENISNDVSIVYRVNGLLFSVKEETVFALIIIIYSVNILWFHVQLLLQFVSIFCLTRRENRTNSNSIPFWIIYFEMLKVQSIVHFESLKVYGLKKLHPAIDFLLQFLCRTYSEWNYYVRIYSA